MLKRDSGHYFNDASIPFPSVTEDDDTIRASKPNRAPTIPLEQTQVSASDDAPPTEASMTTLGPPTSSAEPMTAATGQELTSALPDTKNDAPIPATYSQRAAAQPDGPVALPAQIAPPEPEEEATFSSETQQLLDLQSPLEPAKVVHLPSEDVQEERMRDLEEQRRRKSDDIDPAKTSRTHLQAQELASSPSSTIGAYSAATPIPPQDSPDTSPDSESAEQSEVLPPKDMRPSPEEQRETEEHDRLLDAQKEIARRQALGDVADPDDQLKWEEREAAARDVEEQAAREEVNGPEGDAKLASEPTQAEEVVEDVERDKEDEQLEESAPTIDVKAVTQPPALDERVEAPTAQEDGDNITVTPRNKAALTIDTNRLQQSVVEPSAQPTATEQERMTTRTSSGVLQRRNVSEFPGRTSSQAGPSRTMMSPGVISPMTIRHPRDAPAVGPVLASQASQRPGRPPGHPRTPSDSQTALDDLIALKGAAEDPDRDYLEPLFRIQAHDSLNVRTTSLPELVRSASKTLSTHDQVTTLEERLDYRILRRVYQLQNANKWSLRQMERQNEPPQSVTYHDHMMAEMKWMRKDFQAERKMKNSVCAWLAQRCADYVAASGDEKRKLQVQIKPPQPQQRQTETDAAQPPDLEHSGESAPEDDAGPPTPRGETAPPSTLIVPPELSDTVSGLQKAGRLSKMLDSLPVTGMPQYSDKVHQRTPITAVSKLVEGKIMPKSHEPSRKRSRYDYEDDAELLEKQQDSKRLRGERQLEPEDQESALFHPEHKPIRDRLHANGVFRPPSEFAMPSIQFYEFRNGSQWIWEDDQKLRRLAKEYSFNWSMIADELQLPASFKSSAERRTPWECFERWVEIDQLPAEMKKTAYFRTWFQRLEQSQQAAERRHQAQVAALQAQNNGQATHVPMRRRTIPTRVEKRKNTRYLWLVDAMRKLARKKEQQAYKTAEGEHTIFELITDAKEYEADWSTAAQRAAAQRKTQSDNNRPPGQPKVMVTPAEWSEKRYQHDQQLQEIARQNRQKLIENQQRQLMAARQAQQQQLQQQQGMQNGVPNQQRPGSSSNMPAQQAQMQPNGQQQPNVNVQMPQQQGRPSLPMATRNGHLAVPQVNVQGVPQAQIRPNGHMPTPQEMQRIAQANAQARNAQYGGQQQYPTPNPSMQSPGSGGMSVQQQMQSSQAMLANIQQQMNNANHQSSQQAGGNHQMSASPSMPPPPAPQGNPQQLSSGHVPALFSIKAQLRAKFPGYSDEQVNGMATEMLKSQSQSTNHARQSAMNAAAGINGGVAPQNNLQTYGHNQAAYQSNSQMSNGNYMNGDTTAQQQPNMAAVSTSPQQHQYAALMRQRQMQQMRMQQSPNATHATLNGSPSMTHASPGMTPVSPNMQYANMNHNQMASAMNMGGMNAQQRPPSRSTTPQMQRLGSSGSVPGVAGGMPSPQLQGSPRGMANMAR